jgi:hypothetical protein
LNILLYNAIGGSGDELYGVEPASYYVKNLLLTMGSSWALALLAPLVHTLHHALLLPPTPTPVVARILPSLSLSAAGPSPSPSPGPSTLKGSWLKSLVLHSLALVWLGVLFSRPHKEERFLYPVYPILAFIAAQVIQSVVNIIGFVCLMFLGVQVKTSPTSSSNGEKKPISRRLTYNSTLGNIFVCLVAFVSLLLLGSRVVSNHKNYGGKQCLCCLAYS